MMVIILWTLHLLLALLALLTTVLWSICPRRDVILRPAGLGQIERN